VGEEAEKKSQAGKEREKPLSSQGEDPQGEKLYLDVLDLGREMPPRAKTSRRGVGNLKYGLTVFESATQNGRDH